MSEIHYILDQTQEADKRLSDAMLYAALTSELGEQITSVDPGWSRDLGPADLV